MFPPPSCAYCGQFVGYHADAYTRWGGGGDQEPPDDEFLCPTHAAEVYQDTLHDSLTFGLPPYDQRPWWHPPAAWHQARHVARGLWVHDLRPRPVIHARVRYDTRNETGTFEVQEWCACGWASGWHPPGTHPHPTDYLMAGQLIRRHIATNACHACRRVHATRTAPDGTPRCQTCLHRPTLDTTA
jgi:hypothetical protein